jgi:TPP-dependent indolepyruvate ferredoxin oxidoreductase alpha subunit
MQARWGTHGDHPAIALAPYTVRETFDLTVRAFNLAERYRTPVIVLLDEILGHVNEKVVFPEHLEIVDRSRPTVPPEEYLPFENTEDGVPPLADFGSGYRFHVTGLFHDETGFPTADSAKINAKLSRIHSKIDDHRDDIVEVESENLEDAEIGVFAYGSSARSARQAVRIAREGGLKVGFLRARTIWPFPGREVKDMADRVRAIVVPELNLGQLAHEVEWGGRRQGPRPQGEPRGRRAAGPAGGAGATPGARVMDYLKYLRKDRLPVIWCAGCGDGTATKGLLRAIDRLEWDQDRVTVVSGIGCSSRATGYLDFNTLHTTHGRPIAFATGVKMANPDLHVVVITGDGDATAIGGNHFIHAARRNIDITVILLNNYIYGMTGGQASPTTPLGARRPRRRSGRSTPSSTSASWPGRPARASSAASPSTPRSRWTR